MNKQKKNIPKKIAVAEVKPKQQGGVKQPTMSARDMNIALLAGVSVIIFICFHYSLQNRFLSNWDDWIYITKDKYITAFTAANFNSMLFHDITLNYYHPLTLLSLAVNYHFTQIDPWTYYLTNILLHILNAVLVFYLIKALMDAMVKVGYKAIPIIPWVVAVGALLHGIHPMHVESVSWMAERKDVMYAVFYFAGLIMYVRYTKGATFRWMLYLNIVLALACVWGMIELSDFSLEIKKGFSISDPVILMFPLVLLIAAIAAELKFKNNAQIGIFYVAEFFILSMFSKPMAVSFPLSLIAVDILLKRDSITVFNTPGTEVLYNIFFKWFYRLIKGSWIADKFNMLVKFFIEKWMFIIIAFLSGMQSIYMQGATNTLAFTNGYTVFQKLLIACYTFSTYMFKAFYPAHLCSYYPFPNLTHDYYLPSVFYVAPLFAAAIVCIPLYLARKNKNLFRVVLFGLGFYLANLVFVLQFLSAGTTIISERYSYVAYFGLIFVLVYLAQWFWQKNKNYHIVIQGLLAGICIIFFYLSYERTKVWHDPETLWTDVINKTADERPQVPYFNLGSYYVDSGRYDKAYVDYAILVKIGSKDPLVFRNLAMIYGMRKQYDSSFYCFARAAQYDSNDASIYTNRAITYANLGKFDLALRDFNKAYSLDTTKNIALAQRADMLTRVGRYADAVKDYDKLINRDPKEPSYYLLRGNNYLNGGNAEMASKDYLHLLALQPKNGECMYDLSLAYHQLKDNAGAMQYANMAQSAGFKLPDNYLNTLK